MAAHRLGRPRSAPHAGGGNGSRTSAAHNAVRGDLESPRVPDRRERSLGIRALLGLSRLVPRAGDDHQAPGHDALLALVGRQIGNQFSPRCLLAGRLGAFACHILIDQDVRLLVSAGTRQEVDQTSTLPPSRRA